jgi:hypothetical protein
MRSIFIISVLALSLLMAGCIQTSPGNGPAHKVQATEAWKPDGTIGAAEYSNWDYLSSVPGKNFTIYWRNDAQYLYMALRGQTDGWVAVGFEPSDWMRDADMIVGYATSNNTTVEDQYCTGNYGPHFRDEDLGGTNDILEHGGKDESGFTVVEFKRKMNTTDKFDKAFVPGQNVSIIWAMADSKSLAVQHNIAAGKGVLTLDQA